MAHSAHECRRERTRYYGAYTIAFLVCAIAAFWYVFATGHELIWEDDGLNQHYTFFVYIGSWIRSALESGTIPLWDYSLGYGSDIICALASWIGDPFNLLSALCPSHYAEYAFQVFAVARLYCAGITFSIFMRSRHAKNSAVLCGALCYAFCGFALAWGVYRHPLFANALILLPLVIWGADRVFKGKSPLVLIVSIALTCIVYFYFAYMICLFLLMFCLIRYATSDREKNLGDFARLAGRFVVYVGIGIGCAAVLLLPILGCVLSMSRLTAGVYVAPLETLGEYLLMPLTFVGGATSPRGLAVGPLAALCTIMLWSARSLRTNRTLRGLRWAILILGIGVCIPFFGHVLNGFSYSSDRWMFGLAFCVSWAVVKVVPQMAELSRREWNVTGCIVIAVAVWMALLVPVWHNKEWIIATIVLWCATFGVLFVMYQRKKSLPLPGSFGRYGLIVALIVVGVGVENFCYLVSPQGQGETKPYVDVLVAWGQAYDRMEGTLTPASSFATSTASESDSITYSSDDASATNTKAEVSTDASSNKDGGVATPYRYDKMSELTQRNSSSLLQLLSVDYYSSIYDQYVDDFRTQLALSSDSDLQSHQFYGSDGRSALEAISGVNSFLVRSNAPQFLPYGYTRPLYTATANGKDYTFYGSDHTLPIAFTYKTAIDPDTYASLSPVQKQQALLQGCVVDDTSVEQIDPVSTDETIPWSVDEDADHTGVSCDGSTFDVTQAGAKVTLDFNGLSNSETYAYFKELNFDDYDPSDLASDDEGLGDRVRLAIADGKHDHAKTYHLMIDSDALPPKEITGDTDRCSFYTGKHTWLVNLGMSDQAQGHVSITFDKAGVYSMDDLQIVCQPMDSFNDYVDALAQQPVDMQLGTNCMTGSVDYTNDSLMYVSVPYSSGWSATVDGSPVEIKRANTAFMAIDVSAGEHMVVFHYETPYLRTGCCVTVLSVALCVLMCVRDRRMKRKNIPHIV